jgi:hypothetical protein
MTYNQYKKFHYLLEIEQGLEKIVSKNIKDIIFGYLGNNDSILYLENPVSKCRIKLEKDSLKFDMYNKKLEKWSSGDIHFSFNFSTPTNLGIGTGMPDIGVTGGNIGNIVINQANVGIGTTIPNNIIQYANPLG